MQPPADTGGIDVPQILPSPGDADAIEEVENLDRDLPPVVEPVAKGGSAELALCRRLGYVDCDLQHRLDGGAGEETVASDLFHLAPRHRPAQSLTHQILVDAGRSRDVADPRRTIGRLRNERADFRPNAVLVCGYGSVVMRPPHPTAVHHEI